MPSLSHDSRLFGIDLSHFGQDLRASWRRLGHSPLFDWLTPDAPIRLLHADGSVSRWLGAGKLRPAPEGDSGGAAFVAIELPEERVLRRALVVPAIADDEVEEAVALDVRSSNPFAQGDLIWGYHAGPPVRGQRRVDVALASRGQAERQLRTLAARLGRAPDEVEVWAHADGAEPIVLAGFGESRRAAHAAAARRRGFGLLLLAALLLLAIAVTPTAKLRLRAIEAVESWTALNRSAAPDVARREALVAASDRLATLRDILSDRVDPLRVIDLVTKALPDDTSLTGLQIDGRKVNISGQTTNTAALMQTIGAQDGLRDVRAPTASSRQPGAPKENFSIEFMLEPKALEHRPTRGTAAEVVPAASGTSGVPAQGAVSTDAAALPSDRERLLMRKPSP